MVINVGLGRGKGDESIFVIHVDIIRSIRRNLLKHLRQLCFSKAAGVDA